MFAAAITASATITKTIGGAGADFASLRAACAWLDGAAITDDVVLEICSNLSETQNSGIINATNFSVTVRPHDGNDYTITYSSPDNTGPSGNFVIGGDVTTDIAFDNHKVTKNVIIDGQYNGDGLKHLKFVGGAIGGTAMLVYGDVTNTVIRNCTLESDRASGSGYAITLRTEKNADYHPNGVIIDNCLLVSTLSSSGQGVYFNSSQRSSVAGNVENTTISNCEIQAKTRGIFINGATNIDVIGCNIKINQTVGGLDSYGIWGNSTVRGTINIKGCNFSELYTMNKNSGSYGMTGIAASAGDENTVWNIENNIFAGLDAKNSTVATCKLVAVRCGDACNVRHNTFVMNNLSFHPTSTPLVDANPIALLYLAGTKKYVVENNIFISHETVANNSLIRGALNENCAHNVFYHDGGNAAIVAGAAVYTDYASLPASAESKWKAVTFDSNMMLDGASITDNDLAVAQVAGITTDILGNTRNNPTYAGAEDPDQLTGFTHHLYEIGDNQGWDAEHSPELTMVEPNVFEGTFDFTADNSYFAFTTVQSSDWAQVHAHRYGGANDNLVTDGSEQELVYGGENSLTIAPGTYKFRVDLNESPAKVYVEGYLYEIGNNIEWNLANHVAMTKVAANVYEKEFVLTDALTYMAFTRSAATADGDWNKVNAARYATGVYQERLDDGSEEVLVKGDGEATITLLPGVYTVRVDFNTNKITVTQSVAKVSFDAEVGYATYYNSKKGYTMPANVTGYAFNYPGGLSQAFEAGQDVPAGVALVLAGPAGTFDLVLKTGVPAVDLANQLRGTDVDEYTTAPTADEYLFYGLSLANPAPELLPDPQSVGFYWMADNGEAFINKAHKAYLALMENVFDPAFLAPAILFNENNATNIENVEGQEKAVKFIQNGQIYIQKNGVVYDAMGRVIR